jgi:hypothetical protein
MVVVVFGAVLEKASKIIGGTLYFKKIMKNIFGKLFFLALLVITVCNLPMHPAHAEDVATGVDIGNQLNAAGQGVGIKELVDPRVTLMLIIRFALQILGLIVFCLIIYAGFVWLTSGGNSEKVATAQKIIRNSVIGLAIILSAYSITILATNIALGRAGGFWDRVLTPRF